LIPSFKAFDFCELDNLNPFGKPSRQKLSNPSKIQFAISGPTIEPCGIPDLG